MFYGQLQSWTVPAALSHVGYTYWSPMKTYGQEQPVLLGMDVVCKDF